MKNELSTPRFFWFSDEFLMRKTLFSQVLRKMRRFYLGNYKKAYVQQSISANREGNCHRCGNCCEFLYRCPFLGRDEQNYPYCRIYGDLRPHACKNYPFDRIDSEVENCGFKFKS